jgi:hypothetical protein
VGSSGRGNGQFSGPQGICCDNGAVYVNDENNHRIQVFDKEGKFVRMWGSSGSGGNGQLNFPYAIRTPK